MFNCLFCRRSEHFCTITFATREVIGVPFQLHQLRTLTHTLRRRIMADEYDSEAFSVRVSFR